MKTTNAIILIFFLFAFTSNLFPQSFPYINTVEFKPNFADYTTNGSSLSLISVRGDTILIAVNYIDSISATNYNSATRILYNYSTDRGFTWNSIQGTELINFYSKYPDIFLYHNGNPTIIAGGQFQSKGGIVIDAYLGLGSPNFYPLPDAGSSLVIHPIMNSKFGTLYSIGDSVNFRSFDPNTGTYGQKSNLYSNPSLTNTEISYSIGANQTGSQIAASYCFINEPDNGGDNIRSHRIQFSPDNGFSWTPPVKWGYNPNTPGVINGDSCQAFWHQDIAYRPGTNAPYLVFATYPYIWNGSSTGIAMEENKGWKICVQSPKLNNGNPVVIADWHNINVLGNMSEYNQLNGNIQVNAAYLSHPSIGFSSDGSLMFAAFSVIQTEKLNNYHFFDIYICMSNDGGSTWSTPTNITFTNAKDEMYPVLPEISSAINKLQLTYQSTNIPGSQNITNNTPVARVNQIYYEYTYIPNIITTVSNEIPDAFRLSQNYPNPFNPSTKIRFDLPKQSEVTLRIYDITGKKVAELLDNEVVNAGTSEVTFDGVRLSTGIYFYTLTAGSYIETKKMLLLK